MISDEARPFPLSHHTHEAGPFNCAQEFLCKEEFKFPQNLFLIQLSVCELSPSENGNFVSHGNTFYEEVRIDVLEVLHSCRAKIESVKAYKKL